MVDFGKGSPAPVSEIKFFFSDPEAAWYRKGASSFTKIDFNDDQELKASGEPRLEGTHALVDLLLEYQKVVPPQQFTASFWVPASKAVAEKAHDPLKSKFASL